MKLDKSALISFLLLALGGVGVLLIAKPESAPAVGAGALGIALLTLIISLRKKK